MKKTVFSIILLFACITAFAQTQQITFQVDMNEQTVSVDGVHLVGAFASASLPEWDPAGIPMSDLDNDGIYEVAIDLNESETYEYKFLNGNAWGTEETVPVECAVSSNRSFTVLAMAEIIEAVCFGSCLICPPPAILQSITFQVDLNQQSISPEGIHLAGDFGSAGLPEWDAAGITMSDVDVNGVYEVTIDLNEGEPYEYRFINGNVWGLEETVPLECALNSNRSFTVSTIAETLDLVCFGECAECMPPAGCIDPLAQNYDENAESADGSCTYLLTVRADMTYEQPISPNGVHIVGDFNAYDPTASLMTDDGGEIYSYTFPWQEGQSVAYRFVNGDSFADQEQVPMECGIEDGFGAYKRQYLMPSGDIVLDSICFAACDACINLVGGCTDPAANNYDTLADIDDNSCSYDVELILDLSIYEGLVPAVYAKASWNGWCEFCDALSDQGDGTWSVTISLAPGNYNFVFELGGEGIESYDGSEPCTTFDGTFFTRNFDVLGPVTYGPVCWNSCDPCPLPQVEVVFRVDMFNETIPAEGAHLAGSFNGWDATTIPLDYLGYQVYGDTVLLDANTFYEYKFINGNTFSQDEDVPVGCESNFNRFFTTGTQNQVMDIVCFGECERCGGCIDPFAANFNPLATYDNGTCAGVQVWGCTYPDADNYEPEATIENGGCEFTLVDSCGADINADGDINTGDLVILLGVFGLSCE